MADYQVNTIADMRALSPSNNEVVRVNGYYAAGDWDDSVKGTTWFEFTFVSGSTANANGGTVIEPNSGNGRFHLNVGDHNHINIKQFGTRHGTGLTQSQEEENKTQIERWWEACSGLGKEAWFPKAFGIVVFYGSLFMIPHKINGLRCNGEQTWLTGYKGTDSRYVDESNSSVFVKSSVVISPYSFGFYYPKDSHYEDPSDQLDDVVFDGIALNASWRDLDPANPDVDPLLLGDSSHNALQAHTSDTNHPTTAGLTFRNCALYNTGSSVDGFSRRNLYLRNCLIYEANHHGTGQWQDVDDIEIHRTAYSWGFYGIDANRSPSTVKNFSIYNSFSLGIKIPNTDGVVFDTGDIDVCAGGGFTTAGGGNAVNFKINDVNIKRTQANGWRFSDNTSGGRGGKLSADECGLNGEGLSYNFMFGNTVDLIIDHIRSVNYGGSRPASVFCGYGGDTTLRSALFENNSGKSGIEFYQDHTLTLVNARFEGVASNEIIIRSSGTIVVKHSRLTKSGGGTVGIQSGITTIELPTCNNVGTQVSGDDLELTVTTNEGDASIPTTTGAVKFYWSDPNEKRFTPNFIGDGVHSDGSWSYTWQNYLGTTGLPPQFVVFAEVTDGNGETSIESRNPETGEYDETLVGEVPDLASPLLIEPSDGTTDISLNPLLRWEKVGGATHYGVKVSKNSDLSTPVVDESNVGDVDEYQLGSLDNNETYYWEITAHDGVNSAESLTWSFTTTTEGVPGVVTRISPLNGATDISLAPTLTWEAESGANKYQLAVWVSGESPIVDSVDIGNVTEYALSNLDAGKTYRWRVRAGNDEGWGNWQPEPWEFTTESAIQTLSVESDIALGDWTVTDATDGADALASLDDESYIGTDVVDGDPYIGKLSSSGKQLPNDKEGWKIKDVRARKTSELIYLSVYEYDDGGDFNLTNYNNNKTLIQKIEVTGLTDTFSNVDVDVTEAGSITDIHNLYIELSFESEGA